MTQNLPLSPQNKLLLVRFPTEKENWFVTHERGTKVLGFWKR